MLAGAGRDHDRLRAILNDELAVSSGMPLSESLRHVAETACQIIGCRYAAAIIRGDDGDLTHFVPVGVDAADAESIGRLPGYGGLIGEVIFDGKVLRVPDIALERGSIGLPSRHPEVRELIGVPIRAGGEVTGGLFLASPVTDTVFSADDEHAARVIATTAGFLVDRSRAAEEAERKHRWLSRSTELTREIVAGIHADPMQVLVERAIDVADADLAAVLLTTADGESLVVTSAAGERAHLLGHRVLRRQGTFTDKMIGDGEPLIVDDMRDTHGNGDIVELLGIQSGLMVPMSHSSSSVGTLALFRYPGRKPFAENELDMASTFAAQMVLALELAEARADRERAALFAERGRIARDLHDHVIQQLFAVGMALQTTVGQVDASVSPRLHAAIDDLDSTILQIRSTIYRLNGPLLSGGATLRTRAEDLLDELGPALGIPIDFDVRGPVDFGVADNVADDVIAVLREAVTNVARHARATRVDVALEVDSHATRVTIVDDGQGMSDTTRRSGLANLRARAEQHGGTMSVNSDGDGTRIQWCVPTHR